MAVGTTSMECYEGEDVDWTFTVNDARITNITGYDIELVIKQTAAALDPALVGPITASIGGALTFTCAFNVDLAPGTYVYSVRRVDVGFNWQLAHGTVTVLDSASIDP